MVVVFTQAWFTADGFEFVAIALWDNLDKAYTFFEQWDIEDQPGEIAARLPGNVGLVPEP